MHTQAIPDVTLLEELGRGQGGVVYSALHRGSTCRVKVPSDSPPDAGAARSFEQDALSLARLRRAGLPRVLQVDSSAAMPYAILDVEQGESLPSELERLSSEGQLLSLALSLTSCLHELHEAGFVHGALSAERVLIGRGGALVSWLDYGNVARPEPFDARDDLLAFGQILRSICARLEVVGSARPRLQALADELANGERLELRTLVLELDQLVHEPSVVPLSYPPPSSAELPATGVHSIVRKARGELRQLRRLWHQRQAQGKVVPVIGPAGSGKSKLLARFARELADAGELVLTVKCRDNDWAPFSALKRMLESHLDGLRHLSNERRAQLQRALCTAAGPLAPHIALLSPRFTEVFRGAPTVLQADVAQGVFIAGIVDFLTKYLEGCERAVLVFDDFQWLDASTRNVLALLVPRVCARGHMVVCGSRDDAESRSVLDRFCESFAPELLETIEVQPLEARDAEELIAEYLGLDGAPSSELVSQLTRLCDGTPLSLLGLLELTLEQGLLRPQEGSWRLDAAAVHQMRLPRASRALIERRLGRLGSQVNEVLRAAAVLRNHIDPALLVEVESIPLDQVRAALQQGVAARLLEVDGVGGYQFVHDCVWEMVLGSMPASEVRALNERVASAMLSARGEEQRDAAFEYALARHHAAGQLDRHPARAFEALRRAAQRALAACDDQLALSFLRPAELAAALAAIEPEREFYVDVAEASLRTGSVAQSLDYFQRALARSAPGFERACVLGRIAWVHHFEGKPDDSWRTLELALRESGLRVPADDTRTLASALWRVTFEGAQCKAHTRSQAEAQTACQLYISCARISTDSGLPRRALSSLLLMAAEAKALEPCRVRVHAELLEAFVYAAVHSGSLWRVRYARAYALAERLADPVAITLCHQLHHVIAGWFGDLEESERQARLCVDERGHWMELGELCQVCFAMYAIETGRGRPVAALSWLERAIERAQQCGRAPAAFGLIAEAAQGTLTSLERDLEGAQLRRRLQRIECADNIRQGYFHELSFQVRVQRAMERGELDGELDGLIAEWDCKRQAPGSAHILEAICHIQIAHARVQQCLGSTGRERAAHLPKLARALRDLERTRRVPMLTAHIQFTRAAYHHFSGRAAESEKLLIEAERVAQTHGCVWVTFAVARLRAHQLRERGLEQAARDQAGAAELIARKYGQMFYLRCIREEFGLVPAAAEPTHREVDAQQVRRHLEALVQISAANSRELSAERQACFILDELLSSLCAERAFLFMRGAGGSVALRAARKLGDEDIGDASDCDMSLVQQVHVTAQTILNETKGHDQHARMCIATALVLREQVVGVLYLDRAEAAGSFSAEDAALLEALANQVPVAIELADALRERDRLQQHLRQAQKMEAIGRLAGGIAHDFNNVLTTIDLAAASLAMQVAPGCTLEDLEEIRDAARRGADLTQQLLMFARGKTALPRSIELQEVVRSLSTTLQRLVRREGRLVIDLGDEPLPLLADRSQLERALMNLCKNASEALPEGGEVRVRLRRCGAEERALPIALAPDAQYAVLEVADTGSGMTEDVRAHLFEPFFTTKGRGGTGLGLANVYAIVQQCGGVIDVSSEPGQGSLFRIFLPLEGERPATPSTQTILPPASLRAVRPPARATVLVVDDEELVRRYIGRMLERAGYDVVVAMDGEDALRVLGDRVHQLDIVVTDVHMPRLGGADLVRRLRAQKPNVKVLFISGEKPDELWRQGALEDAMFLSKPFDGDTLLSRLQATQFEACANRECRGG